jgi:type III secretion protein L
MLVRRSLELRDGAGLVQPLITRETLRDCGRAEAVLAQAQERAEDLLRQAERQREALLQQARQQFWQQAEAQLGEWERQRQRMWDLLEEHARELVNQALGRLLDEVPAAQRIDALLAQLLRSQREPMSATLHCHPQSCAAVQQWLERHGDSPWRLHPDDSLAADELCLASEHGDFRIDWRAARDALLVADV